MFLQATIERALGRRSVSIAPTAAARASGHRELASRNEVRNRELHQISRQSDASHRGLFDPLFSGLSIHAAEIDAAIFRRTCLR